MCLQIFGMPDGISLPLISFSRRQTVHSFEEDIDQAINLEEQLASMMAMLERLSKENAEKDAKIKHQNKPIIDLTKTLEKWPFKASNNGSQSKDSGKESNHSEDSDEEHKSKKDSSLHWLSIEQIQSLVADAVKLKLW